MATGSDNTFRPADERADSPTARSNTPGQISPGPNAHDDNDRPNEVSPLIDATWTWHDETDVLLRAAIESANDAIIITEALIDLPGPRIEYVNPAFCTMTGYSLDEILGKTPRILQGPRTDPALLHRLRDDLKHERNFHGETVNYRKDGSEYFVEWRITPLRDSEGRFRSGWRFSAM